MLSAASATALFVALTAYYMSDVYNTMPTSTPQKNLKKSYDFIIVGAGSAGSVLANRLTEVRNFSVLLIEAGYDEGYQEFTPMYFSKMDNATNWNYTTVEQKNACRDRDGICLYPRGYVMGGSSSINAMLYVRGNKADYDGWKAMGLDGWDWSSVFPYFLRSENMTYSGLTTSRYHSTQGPLKVSVNSYATDASPALIEAGKEIGFEFRDYNGEMQSSVWRTQVTVGDGIRYSTSRAYLSPIRKRKNLDIVKGARVTRVIIDKSKKKALGVEYELNGRLVKVKAEDEVILSAGAINTPQVLMLSGIGPKDHLKELGIPVVADLPVGENLQDHTLTCLNYYLNDGTTLSNTVYQDVDPMLDYVINRTGPYTNNRCIVFNFFKSSNDLTSDPPEIQLHWSPNSFGEPQFVDNPQKNYITVCSTPLQPKSRGTVRLRSKNYKDAPLIDTRYFTEVEDQKVASDGVTVMQKIMASNAMAKLEPVLDLSLTPACANLTDDNEAFLKCLNLYSSRTLYHPVGTARMGGVVNANLKVKGIKSLRVVDASVMPVITRGNTNAPTIMIAEKIADTIKKSYKSR